MSESSAPAACSEGHLDSVRLLSVFASVGGSASPRPGAAPAPAASSGGVCGSGCGCHHWQHWPRLASTDQKW